MVAYNFQKQFVPLLLDGSKPQTIRALGKRRHARKGDTVQIYTGQRTKHCQKLFEAECIKSQSVCMYIDSEGSFNVELNGIPLELNEIEKLAVDDGFEEMDGLIRFFEAAHGFPFEGVLICWDPPTKAIQNRPSTEQLLKALEPTNFRSLSPSERYSVLAAVGAKPTPELKQARSLALAPWMPESPETAIAFGGTHAAA